MYRAFIFHYSFHSDHCYLILFFRFVLTRSVKPYSPFSALFNAKSILLDVQFDGSIIGMNERAVWICPWVERVQQTSKLESCLDAASVVQVAPTRRT
jgi:hypothetical protein